jgi:hypothetical protein
LLQVFRDVLAGLIGASLTASLLERALVLSHDRPAGQDTAP